MSINEIDGYLIHWESNDSEGYDWSVIALVENSNGEFAVYSDGGCSCNYPYEDGWDSGLSWTRDLTEIKRKCQGGILGYSYQEATQDKAKLNRVVSNLRRKVRRQAEKG